MRRRLSNSIVYTCMILLMLSACKQDRDRMVNTPSGILLFSQLIEEVEMSDSSAQYVLVDDFLDSVDFPFMENDTTVYFLYEGEVSSVSVAGDFSGWNPTGRSFTQLRDTKLWYRKEHFESDARLDYKIVLDGSNWILDPGNPNQIGGGFGPNSELAMPNYLQPEEILEVEGVPKGSISNVQIASGKTGKTYTVYIYLPPDYDDTKSYPVSYFQDGADYLSLASANIVMDNLIDKELVKPLIGVFVVPTDRNKEYAFEDRFDYADFFVNELVPYIDSNYNTVSEPEARAVIGDSYGGNISAIIAFHNPEIFGNCGLHSGAFQPNNFHTNSIVMDGVKKNIKVTSVWGTYEGSSLPPNMRAIRDYLIDEGYDIHWKELHEGHSWGLWRATLDEMLVHFFPN